MVWQEPVDGDMYKQEQAKKNSDMFHPLRQLFLYCDSN